MHLAILLAYFITAITCAYFWALNLIHVATNYASMEIVEVIIHIAGVPFMPLGVVLGFIL